MFKRRMLMLFGGLAILLSLTVGMPVSAQDDTKVCFADLSEMSKEAIYSLDIATLEGLIDEAKSLHEEDADSVDESILLLVMGSLNQKQFELSYSKTLVSEPQVIDSVGITRGTDQTIYSATLGTSGGWTGYNGHQNHYHDIGFNRNRVECWGTTLALAQAWSYTGEQFSVSGSEGSQAAYVRYNGFGWADITTVMATSTFRVTVEIYDVTAGWSKIGTRNVIDIVTGGSYDNAGGYFADSLYVSLTTGHTYEVRVLTYSEISVPFFSAAGVYSYSPDYSMWTSIQVDWQ